MLRNMWKNRLILHAVSSVGRNTPRRFTGFAVPEHLARFYQINKTKALMNAIQESESLHQTIKSRTPFHKDLTNAIHERLRFEWTYHSNAIEGNTLSLGDTIFFLREGLTVQGKPLKDFLEARNHSNAIDYLQDVLAGDLHLSPGLLKEINSLLLRDLHSEGLTDSDGKRMEKMVTIGEYKTQPNHVIQLDGKIHHYVEPIQVRPQIEFLFNWINRNFDTENPIITATVAHYNKVRIHPFDEGNGRGARILMNLILMKAGRHVAIIRNEDRNKYLNCLGDADQGNLTPFAQLVADAVIRTQKLVLLEEDSFQTHNGHSIGPKK